MLQLFLGPLEHGFDATVECAAAFKLALQARGELLSVSLTVFREPRPFL